MRTFRLREAPVRARTLAATTWTIEVDDDGIALLCGDAEPFVAARSLASLLEALGVDERAIGVRPASTLTDAARVHLGRRRQRRHAVRARYSRASTVTWAATARKKWSIQPA